MSCREDQKVSFSAFMFQKEAKHWWETVKRGVKVTRRKITWRFFVDKFTEKYIPRTAKDKLALEFQELQQSQMIVTQYDQKFTQLSRYAGGLVIDEEEMIKRFLRDLKPEI